jgi:peptidoglycan/xylan/chitin deacetylase (PgdA/CDA1 family)
MFELIEIYKNQNFLDRIFPINIDAKIYKAIDQLAYRHYWENALNELQTVMKQGELTNLHGIVDDLNLYDEIKRNLPNLTNILKNINLLTPTLHTESDFQHIIQAITTKLNQPV